MRRTITALAIAAAIAVIGSMLAACGGSSAPTRPTQSQMPQVQETSTYPLSNEGEQNKWTQNMLDTAMKQFIAGPGAKFTDSQDRCVANYLQTTVTIEPYGFVHPDGTLTDAIATQAYNWCVTG
jgi:hypothetical protein